MIYTLRRACSGYCDPPVRTGQKQRSRHRYVQRHDRNHARAGKPISPHTKTRVLMTTRMFFRDCQEWEWIRAGLLAGWLVVSLAATPRSPLARHH